MNATEALEMCPQLRLVHVETIDGQGKSTDPELDSAVGKEDHELADIESRHRSARSAAAGNSKMDIEKVSLERYRKASVEIMKVFRKFVPDNHIERASIDESFLDLTEIVENRLGSGPSSWPDAEMLATIGEEDPESPDILRRFAKTIPELHVVGDSLSDDRDLDRRLVEGARIAKQIRDQIWEDCKFTSSAGIASNKMLAKLVAGFHKPAQQTLLPQSAVSDMLVDVKLGKVRGLGGKLGRRLGCETIGEVRNLKLETLRLMFGEATAVWVFRIVRGIDDSQVVPRTRPQSLLAGKSFTAVHTLDSVLPYVRMMAAEVAARMAVDKEEHNRVAQTLVLHFRTLDRRPTASGRKMRSKSMPMPRGGKPDDLVDAAMRMLASCGPDMFPCSHLSMAAHHFSEAPKSAEEGGLTKFFSASTHGPVIPPTRPVERVKPRHRTLKDFPAKSSVDTAQRANTTAAQADQACPICAQSLSGLLNSEVNAHIDSCLSGKPAPLRAEKRRHGGDGAPSSKRGIASFFGGSRS